jgi:hypothetical protein
MVQTRIFVVGRRLLVTAATTLGIFVAAAPAAEADTFCAWHGDDVGCVHVGHSSFAACDREPDGHKVRAWVISEFGDTLVGPFDDNGSASGCDGASYVESYDLVRVRTCEEVVGCSDWVPISGPHPV